VSDVRGIAPLGDVRGERVGDLTAATRTATTSIGSGSIPALKLACGRLPDISQDLCSQPTISRRENAQSLREIIRLNYRLVDIWCRVIRSRVVLDIDNTVDVVARHKSKSSAKGGR
jgi:Transposase DDE domain group 1